VSLQLPKDTQFVNFVMHILDHFCDFYISLFIVNHNLNTSYSGLHHTISLMYVGARHLGFGIT